MTAGTSSHLAPASHSSRRPRRLWQCGDVRARDKPVGATSAARGTPAGATSARARSARRCDVRSRRGDTHARGGAPVLATSAPRNARRGDARARRGRPSGRQCSRLRMPAGATSARAGDARRGDVSAGSGRCRAARVGATSARRGRPSGRGPRARGAPAGALAGRALATAPVVDFRWCSCARDLRLGSVRALMAARVGDVHSAP